MYDRFNDAVRTIMHRANAQAQEWGHAWLGSEHVLMNLISCSNNNGLAVLKCLNVDTKRLLEDMKSIIVVKEYQLQMGCLPHTPRLKRILKFAIQESQLLSHDYVGPEHLLLGMLREPDSIACQFLIRFPDVNLGFMRCATQALAQGKTWTPSSYVEAVRLREDEVYVKGAEHSPAIDPDMLCEYLKGLLGTWNIASVMVRLVKK